MPETSIEGTTKDCTGNEFESGLWSDAVQETYDWFKRNTLDNGIQDIAERVLPDALKTSEGWLKLSDTIVLQSIEKAHFNYFKDNTHKETGLTLDRSREDAPASIAATGFALTAFPIGVERGWVSREEARDTTLKALRTLWNTEQGDQVEKTSGKNGFFYHFLNAEDGTRAGNSEISTIDTALLMSGIQFARSYYDREDGAETEIRDLAQKLYERVDWQSALTKEGTISHGWLPETGMIPHSWSGFDEASVLMIMAAGSPTHPIDQAVVDKYFSSAKVETVYGQEHVVFGPLFGHQYAQSWVDFRGVTNPTFARHELDLFENSRRAALAQNLYAQDNPNNWKGYSNLDWGLTACDGPGPSTKMIEGKSREFHGYIARGFPHAPDDGTIAPTAAASSLPFAPEIVLPTLRHWSQNRKELLGPHGYYDAFNMTIDSAKPSGWVGIETIGIDQGATLLGIENYRSEFVWNTMRRNKDVVAGLRNAGFNGGWLIERKEQAGVSTEQR